MILKRMTAVFGKLDGETLTLQPGLNLIEAPNEWGKSTWCAFLLSMLYGVDTAQRASKGALPVKERYKPWSGKPMEGRIDLVWQGRNITIQRTTKGRIPMGEFRAFETDTGNPVAELTRENCGLMLLGVERSVYERCGFLREQDLPVTQDEALFRRLNALVTTGEESPAGLTLEKQLKDLKNRCQFKQQGLLPQAKMQRDELRETLSRMESAAREQARMESRLHDLSQEAAEYEGHIRALEAQKAQEKRQAVAASYARAEKAKQEALRLGKVCSVLPSREEAEIALAALHTCESRLRELAMEEALEPEPPAPKAPPAAIGSGNPVEQAKKDLAACQYFHAKVPENTIVSWIFPIILLVLGVLFLSGIIPIPAPVRHGFGAGLCLFAIGLVAKHYLLIWQDRRAMEAQAAKEQAILASWGAAAPADILPIAQGHADALVQYEEALARHRAAREQRSLERQSLLEQEAAFLAEGEAPSQAENRWNDVLLAWNAWSEAQRQEQRLAAQAAQLAQVAGSLSAGEEAPLPTLPLSMEEAQEALAETRTAEKDLRRELDLSRGRNQALGDPAALAARLEALDRRIEALEDMNAALGYAQDALKEASSNLRRQFAPKITGEAREIFARLTEGRYDKLLWEEDLSLSAGQAEETVYREALRRSDGTVDQMYLSLRLAVSRSLLAGDTPLVLDDALVRFDDKRLKAALNLLQEEGQNRQILLFTCHSREQKLLSQSTT